MNHLQIKVTKKYPELKYRMNTNDDLKFPELEMINLSLTFLGTYNIIDKINDHLLSVCKYYNTITDKSNDDPITLSLKSTSFTLYYLEVEELVYWIRKYIDIIINISYILNYLRITGKEPQKMEIDSIGKYMNCTNLAYKCFEDFLWLFTSVNDISNYYKHSIYNTNLNIFGKLEPCISALGLKNHNFNLYNISLAELVSNFETFSIKSKEILNDLI